MNDPYIEPAERRRRLQERDKARRKLMKVLRPLGFVEEPGGKARMLSCKEVTLDMDARSIQVLIETPADVVECIYFKGFHDGAALVKATLKNLLG